MTVGAISSYSPAVQYRYFDTTISDSQIQGLMKKYGITPTGDSDKDLDELYSAMYSDAQSSVAASASFSINNNQQAQKPLNIPWQSLMIQVGLYPTGDFNTDYKAFKDKIIFMQYNATSKMAKTHINQLIAEAAIVFVQPTVAAAQIGLQTPKISQSSSGADILAQLNRTYFLG